MGMEAALVASAFLGAASQGRQAGKTRQTNRRIADAREASAEKQRSAQFQESERQLLAQRGQQRFEQQAGQQLINERARARGVTPVFSDLASSVLNPRSETA